MSIWPSVGMKCVCVKRDPWRYPNGMIAVRPARRPTYGETLTIRDVVGGECICLRFDEIRNPLDRESNTSEVAFNVRNFRPLITKTQSEDAETFRKIADLAGVDTALRVLNGEDA